MTDNYLDSIFTKVTFENIKKKPIFYLKIGQKYAFFKESIHISKRQQKYLCHVHYISFRCSE